MKSHEQKGPPVMEAEHPGNSIVEITVNGDTIEIHRGAQRVSTIKESAGVPAADVMEQIIDGKLTTLNNDDKVVLKGGEKFISHPNSGAAS